MKVSSRVLLSAIALVMTACAGGGSSNAPAPKQKNAPVSQQVIPGPEASLQGACSSQALPEITTAEGKEVQITALPQGEYSYVGGEMYVYNQDAAKTSTLDALVIDKGIDSGNFEASLNCSKVDMKEGAKALSANGDLQTYLNLVVNADGSFSTTGARHIVAKREEASDKFALEQNTDTAVKADITVEQVASALKQENPVIRYFVTDDAMTMLVKENGSKDDSTTINFYKLSFKRVVKQ